MGPVCCKPVQSQYSLSLSGNVALQIYYHPLLGRANRTGHAQAMCEIHYREVLQEQQPCAVAALSCAHFSRRPICANRDNTQLTYTPSHSHLCYETARQTPYSPLRSMGNAVQYLSRPDPVEMVSLKDPPPCTAQLRVKPGHALPQCCATQMNADR